MITRRQVLVGMGAAMIAPYLFSQPVRSETVRVRRDLTTLPGDDPFFSQYAEAITRMHALPDSDPRSWRNQAIIHANYCPHGMNDFLEWHRFYITYFEKICGEMINDPDFALPYWNWSNNEGKLPAQFFEDSPLNVVTLNDPSDYTPPPWSRSGWSNIQTVGTRALTSTTGLMSDPRFSQIFDENAIDGIKRLSDFELFQQALEGNPHNTGHVLVGVPNGHMINGLSSLDPVFWLHHCNVDRIWAEWQTAMNVTPASSMQYDGQFFDSTGQSLNVTSVESHDFRSMGFTYDSVEPEEDDTLDLKNLSEKTIAAAFTAQQGEIRLGITENNKKSTINTPTNLKVDTPDLADNLYGSRVFKATKNLSWPRNAVEASRIMAVLKGVSYPAVGDERIVVNVFVDCPYISPVTPSTDPHFAGAFSFFGQPMKDMKMGGNFVVDLTRPVRNLAGQGRLKQKELNVQLMPVMVTPDGPKEAEFKVSSIEILRV